MTQMAMETAESPSQETLKLNRRHLRKPALAALLLVGRRVETARVLLNLEYSAILWQC